MSRTLQFKRYSNTALLSVTGAVGELIVDTTNKTITVHDGTTAGGTRLATERFVGINPFAQAAFNQANTAGTTANSALTLSNYGIGVNLSQNTNITTATNLAQAAFNKANNALANTSGTFDGNLNVAGTINVNNVLTVTTSPPASSPSITTITTQNYNLSLQTVSNTWTFVANGALLFPDNTIQIGGSISRTQLKSLVASSATYAAFQAAIAAL